MLKAILTGLVAIPLALLIAVIVSAIVAWPVQYLYNSLWANHPLGGLYHISFKTAWTVTLLCRLLLGSK